MDSVAQGSTTGELKLPFSALSNEVHCRLQHHVRFQASLFGGADDEDTETVL